MPEVRFTTARQFSPTISVVSAAAYPKVFVSLGGTRDCFTGEVHYIPALERSVPHEQKDCPHCSYPMISKTWVPAAMCPLSFGRDIMEKANLPLMHNCGWRLKDWQTKVVELPPSAMMLASELERGRLFAICRGLGRQHKKVLYHAFETRMEGMGPCFDPRPILMKTWGLGDYMDDLQK
jgi:hypothetical protein